MVAFQTILIGLLTAAIVEIAAHPGHDVAAEVVERQAYFNSQYARRSLAHCMEHLEKRGINSRSLQRRAATVAELRKNVALKKRGIMDLDKRQSVTTSPGATSTTVASLGASGAFPSSAAASGQPGATGGTEGASVSLSDYGSEVANTSHLINSTFNVNSPNLEETLFGNSSYCILTPESEVGPYYVGGELIRKDITEGEPGVPLSIEAQFIDINTCEPITDLYWDVWHCNSTGVYAGVVATGNGNSDDQSNLNKTSLRGIQKTDSDGVAGFDTVFPGHYSGRTTHFHVVTHIGATQLSNNTLTGGNISHTGQFFFDQSVIYEIEQNVSPYNTNNITITKNADDRVFADATVTTGADPVFDYVKLGDDISDGLFAWVIAGVDPTSNYTASEAAHYYASGGVASSDSGPGGMPNDSSPNNSTIASTPTSRSLGSSSTVSPSASSSSTASPSVLSTPSLSTSSSERRTSHSLFASQPPASMYGHEWPHTTEGRHTETHLVPSAIGQHHDAGRNGGRE